jgi:hypothetical protein
MNIRITGLPAEVTQTLQDSWHARTPGVIQAGGPYPNRGDSRLVRVCIQAQLHPGSGAVP